MSYKWFFPIKTELSAPNNDWVTYLVFNNKTIHCGQQQIMTWAKVDNNYKQSSPSSKNVNPWSIIYSEPQWAQK